MKQPILIIFFAISSIANAAPLNLVTGSLNSGQVFTRCNFDGNQQECMIDTGSTRTFIKKDAFSLSYPSMGVVEPGGASGSKIKCDLIDIKSFSIDSDFFIPDLQATRCPVDDTDDTAIANESVIGLNIFENKIVYFDFLNSELLHKQLIPEQLIKRPMNTQPRGHFSISLESGDIPTYGLWDTGAGLTSIDEEFVKKYPDNFEYIKDIWGNDGIGKPIPMKLYNAKEISIGEVTFENVHVIAFDFSPIRPYFDQNIDYIIGFNLVTKANWYFDFNTKQWAIE